MSKMPMVVNIRPTKRKRPHLRNHPKARDHHASHVVIPVQNVLNANKLAALTIKILRLLLRQVCTSFQVLIVGNTEIIYDNFLFFTENNQLASCNDIKVETTGTNTIATSTMTSSSKSNGAQTTSIRIAPSSTVKVSKAQKKEDNARSENSLAAIMMGYVLVFLICHSPRLILNLHELMTIR